MTETMPETMPEKPSPHLDAQAPDGVTFPPADDSHAVTPINPDLEDGLSDADRALLRASAPWLWPFGEVQDFGDGLYGARFSLEGLNVGTEAGLWNPGAPYALAMPGSNIDIIRYGGFLLRPNESAPIPIPSAREGRHSFFVNGITLPNFRPVILITLAYKDSVAYQVARGEVWVLFRKYDPAVS